MITLKQIAEYFEKGLNELYGNPYIKFHIWADAGKFDKPFRDGNTVTHYITGNLRTSTSSNDANLLVMGTNGLSLDFSIPVKRPRTTANQSAAELQEIADGQYPFVQEIAAVINKYFQEAQSFTLMDGTEQYSLSFQAGTSLSGVVDIQSQLGKHVTASVYVQLYFIKGGVISSNVAVSIDGVRVPFQVVRMGRSTESERDIYADSLISKSIASSSAFSIDIQFPISNDNTSSETLNFLLDGTPNTAHFVSVQYGLDAKEKFYFMTIDNATTNAQGVTVSGVTVAFIETLESPEVLNYPNTFQVGRLIFDDSSASTVSFRVSQNCMAFFDGKARELQASEANIFINYKLSQGAFEYDEETKKYYVYIITNKSVMIFPIKNSVPFEVIKEAKNV